MQHSNRKPEEWHVAVDSCVSQRVAFTEQVRVRDPAKSADARGSQIVCGALCARLDGVALGGANGEAQCEGYPCHFLN